MTTTPTEEDDMDEIAAEERARAREEVAALSAATYVVPEPGADDHLAPGECDVIMKGGITSGVVYPLTICKLATRFRLRSIGGTSAGAIAAALAAAAEYRRQHDDADPAAGYQELARMPLDISSRLGSLFQAPAGTRRILDVLLALMEGGVWSGISRVVRSRLGWFVGGVALVLAVAVPGLLLTTSGPLEGGAGWRIVAGLVLPTALGLVVGVVLAVVGFVLSALKVLPRHDFGLTDGATHSGDPQGEPALTPWLADQIDRVAGVTDGCLTLGDLWGAEGIDAWRAFLRDGDAAPPIGDVRRRRDIDLETMTTNLTLRRPLRLPFRQQVFLFDEDEMRGLFPARVVATMTRDFAPSRHLNPTSGKPLRYFPGPGAPKGGIPRPGPESLPLVVMARMSLSFPGLISAVPLYAVDHGDEGRVVRHLFSDGGLTSNFPMHFFDSFLPRRPTFGINLAGAHPAHPEQLTWIPRAAGGGVTSRAQPFDSVGGFGRALRDAVQNWSDNTQVTQRGYAERVVEIRLRPGEGGMNLQMPEHVIMALVLRGAEAGDLLLGFEWDAHRVIRYRTAMIRLSEALENMADAWTQLDYEHLVDDYPTSGAAGSSYVRSRPWRRRDLAATRQLLATVAQWSGDDWPALRADRPAPAPLIRMAPE